MLTKSQQMMVDDGLPESLLLSKEQRAEEWKNHPIKPMPKFDSVAKSQDQATLQLLAEMELNKKVEAKNRISKMLIKKEDRTGQHWDFRKAKWISDDGEKPMISITTNTRGATKMPAAKDYAEMSGPELVAAYNKKSGKPPIKKFKDKATGLAAMAKLMSKPSAATAPLSEIVRKVKPEPKEGSANKLAAEFGARVGSFREKLLIALDENYKKMVPVPELLKATYGSKNIENAGALTMVLKGAQTMIEKNELPYTLKKEKNEAKEISYGLFPK